MYGYLFTFAMIYAAGRYDDRLSRRNRMATIVRFFHGSAREIFYGEDKRCSTIMDTGFSASRNLPRLSHRMSHSLSHNSIFVLTDTFLSLHDSTFKCFPINCFLPNIRIISLIRLHNTDSTEVAT